MKRVFGIIILIGIFLFFAERCSSDIFLPKYGKCINSKISTQTYSRRWHKDEYLYELVIEGNSYFGNSGIEIDSSHQDSICVVYLPIFPSINMRRNYFINDGVNLNCNCP
jgi:hypothetical protein